MGEWNGAWADGSKEWTPYWLQKLDHRFGDDGLFWMSYDDLTKRFELLDRTRLFDNAWTVVQSWTSLSVAWVTGYLNTKFVVEIKKGGPTVFVLCQLDGRYFRGLEGKYNFDLHFVLQAEGAPAGDHIVRARGAWVGDRSVSAEVTLDPGTYEVVPKIVAERDDDVPDVYEVVTKVADRNPQKLRQIGMNYDIANAKGVEVVSEEEKKKREEKKKKEEEEKEREKAEKAEFEAWRREKMEKENKKDQASEEKAAVKKTDDEEKTPEEKTHEEKTHEEKTETPDKAQEPQNDDPKPDPEAKDTKSNDTQEQPTETDDPSKPTTQPTTSPNDPPTPSQPADTDPATEPTPAPPADAATDPLPAPAADQQPSKKWNAICVLGLRVYSQDPEVSIKLVRPKDAEEGALLDVDGAQAGATRG